MSGGDATGRLTAMAMHDMLNVLAVLKENAGLLEDLVGLEPAIPKAQKARFATLFTVMREQFGVGADLAEALKRYGAQAAQEEAEVAPLLRLLLSVIRRKAKGRRISFIVDEAGAAKLRAQVAPHRLASLLFAALERAVDALPGGSVVSLRLMAQAGRGAVRFSPAGGVAVDWAGALAACRDGEVVFEITDGGTGCGVCFPCAQGR